MLTDKQRRDAAQSLIAAERDHAPIDPISTTYPGADVEDAYRISILVAELKVAAGRSIKGHKIGLTSKAITSCSPVRLSRPSRSRRVTAWLRCSTNWVRSCSV